MSWGGGFLKSLTFNFFFIRFLLEEEDQKLQKLYFCEFWIKKKKKLGTYY